MAGDAQRTAQTILEQITTATKMELGLRSAVYGKEKDGRAYLLAFVDRGASRKFKIRLEADDTYTIEYWKIKPSSLDVSCVPRLPVFRSRA